MAQVYQNVNGKLRVIPDAKAPEPQDFSYEQIEDMIVNTQAQRDLKFDEIVEIDKALVDLAALLKQAKDLGVEKAKVEAAEI